ncbi:MAG: hemolysin family protein [SAR324 cluster bacterium]|nr:hemolysin family protein [SAR324 cluster bacterium]
MITGFIVLGLLLVLSAFFSGVESAFINLGDLEILEIEKEETRNAKILLKLLENKERLLSVILIGNNLSNIGASSLATAIAISYSKTSDFSEEATVAMAAGTLTLFILLFGEITPKSLAIAHSRKISLDAGPIILFLSWVFYPLAVILDVISSAITKISRGGEEGEENLISEVTVINVVNKGEEQGAINEREKTMIENVFLFDDREVYPIMTPRPKVFALNEESTLDEVKEELLTHQFSRIPIFKKNIDQIDGVVQLTTLLQALLAGKGGEQLKNFGNKPLFVYETLAISTLLERFRNEGNHLAVVVDEYGGMAGIVTLEDILEELVGEIFDEKDTIQDPIRPMGFQKWLVAGSTDLVAINREITGANFNEDGSFESIQGLIMSSLERLPKTGDLLKVGEHLLTVMKMRQNEIISVMIEYQTPND